MPKKKLGSKGLKCKNVRGEMSVREIPEGGYLRGRSIRNKFLGGDFSAFYVTYQACTYDTLKLYS